MKIFRKGIDVIKNGNSRIQKNVQIGIKTC